MFTKNLSLSFIIRTIILLSASVFIFTGCIPNEEYKPVTKQKKPGFYGTKGWAYNSCYFPRGGIGDCGAKDIEGKVGYSIFVIGPRSTCVPDGSWTKSTPVFESGELPPGLSFNQYSGIEGVPEKRGHWIVKLRIDNMYCGGVSYYGFKQELRFHISGSGKVNY